MLFEGICQWRSKDVREGIRYNLCDSIDGVINAERRSDLYQHDNALRSNRFIIKIKRGHTETNREQDCSLEGGHYRSQLIHNFIFKFNKY